MPAYAASVSRYHNDVSLRRMERKRLEGVVETAQMNVVVIGGDDRQRDQIRRLFIQPGRYSIDVFEKSVFGRSGLRELPADTDCLIVLADSGIVADGLSYILENTPAGIGLVLIAAHIDDTLFGAIGADVVVLGEREVTAPRLTHALQQATNLRRSMAPAVRPLDSLFGELHNLVTALGQTSEVQQVFTAIGDACRKALGAAGLVVAMPNEKDQSLRLIHTAGYDPDALRWWNPAPGKQATPLSDALLHGEIVELSSPETITERYNGFSGPATPSIQSLVCAPFSVGAAHQGAIGMSFAESRDLSSDERQFLQIVCSQMSETLSRFHFAESALQAHITAQTALHDRETFLATAAHEIRTPLTLILGQAQLLQRRLDPDNAQHEQMERSLDVIIAQTQRLSRLMTSMVSVFQLEDGSLELKHLPIDLNELVSSVVHEMQRTITTHKVTFAPAKTPAMIMGDPMYLEQVLHHLVQNAVRFSEMETEIHIGVRVEQQLAQLIVRDQGSGIPIEDIAELFRRFSRIHDQTPQHRRGLGIGLYLVREVIDRHGGTVLVEHAAQGGTQFTMTLPLARSSARPTAE